MGGVLPETCWAIKKHWNNKFYYTVASCWFFLWDLYYDAQIHEHHVSSCIFHVPRANSEKYYRPTSNLRVRYKNTGIQVTIQNSHFVWHDLHKWQVLCHSSACAWTQSGPISDSSMEKHSNVHTTEFYIWKKSTWENCPEKKNKSSNRRMVNV